MWDILMEGLQRAIILLGAGFPVYSEIWYAVSRIMGMATRIGKPVW